MAWRVLDAPPMRTSMIGFALALCAGCAGGSVGTGSDNAAAANLGASSNPDQTFTLSTANDASNPIELDWDCTNLVEDCHPLFRLTIDDNSWRAATAWGNATLPQGAVKGAMERLVTVQVSMYDRNRLANGDADEALLAGFAAPTFECDALDDSWYCYPIAQTIDGPAVAHGAKTAIMLSYAPFTVSGQGGANSADNYDTSSFPSAVSVTTHLDWH